MKARVSHSAPKISGWPTGNETLIKKLATGDLAGKISRVSLPGNDNLSFEQTSTGLKVKLPEQALGKDAFVLKIEGAI
jgi:alpha-L-fucosidase